MCVSDYGQCRVCTGTLFEVSLVSRQIVRSYVPPHLYRFLCRPVEQWKVSVKREDPTWLRSLLKLFPVTLPTHYIGMETVNLRRDPSLPRPSSMTRVDSTVRYQRVILRQVLVWDTPMSTPRLFSGILKTRTRERSGWWGYSCSWNRRSGRRSCRGLCIIHELAIHNSLFTHYIIIWQWFYNNSRSDWCSVFWGIQFTVYSIKL